jgi:NitT/TauT family transport system substrate-binding protein
MAVVDDHVLYKIFRGARMSRIVGFLLVVYSGLLFSPAAVAQPLTTVRYSLDWRFEGQLAFYMLALKKGYFEKEGVDLKLDAGTGSIAAINRVVAGSHDMATADMSSVIEFLGNNPSLDRFQAIYVMYNRAPFIIQTLKKNGIRKPQDLAGKKMASPVFDSVRKAFPIYAKAIGIDPNSVTWLSVDPALRETLLARGDVDAVPGFEMNKLTLIERGVRPDDIVTFSYADAGLKLYGNVVIASNKLVAENPKAVAGVVRAINRALIETIANPEEAIKYIKYFDATADEQRELAKLKTLFRAVDTPETRANGLGGVNNADLQNQVNDIASTFQLKTKPKSDAIFNANFLPPKTERMPTIAK